MCIFKRYLKEVLPFFVKIFGKHHALFLKECYARLRVLLQSHDALSQRNVAFSVGECCMEVCHNFLNECHIPWTQFFQGNSNTFAPMTETEAAIAAGAASAAAANAAAASSNPSEEQDQLHGWHLSKKEARLDKQKLEHSCSEWLWTRCDMKFAWCLLSIKNWMEFGGFGRKISAPGKPVSWRMMSTYLVGMRRPFAAAPQAEHVSEIWDMYKHLQITPQPPEVTQIKARVSLNSSSLTEWPVASWLKTIQSEVQEWHSHCLGSLNVHTWTPWNGFKMFDCSSHLVEILVSGGTKARIPIYMSELFRLWAHPWTCLNWMQSSCGQSVELNAIGCQSAWSACPLVRFACRAQVNPFKVEHSHGFLGNYYRAALPVTHADIHVPDPHSIGFIGKDANSHWAGTDRNGLCGQTAVDKLIWPNSSRSWVPNQRVWHCLASSI